MRIVEHHSHLNGLEYLWVRKKSIWEEIGSIVESVDPHSCYSATETSEALKAAFGNHEWLEDGSDLLKDRVAVEVRLESHPSMARELFARHLASYMHDRIDTGIEILPTKELQTQMPSGVAYYEDELYRLTQQGRGVPRVPLVLIGVAA